MEGLDILYDWASDPKILRDTYKSTKFDAYFFKFISKNVITTMNNDDLIRDRLFKPLEDFICDGSTITHLQTLKQPSRLCRRVLKTGDVLFSCNDCGYDATCVVCIDCFHKGAHKNHNYRMSNTDGGGCCDCGDVEAWKQNYACSDHGVEGQTSLDLTDYEDIPARANQIEKDRRAIIEKIAMLPGKVASRYFSVCQASLNYARYLLSWKDPTNLPPWLEPWNYGDEKDFEDVEHLIDKHPKRTNYFTVMFNDEVHTYDNVINTLVKVIKCSRMDASTIASTVSREGRSLVHQGDHSSCEKAQITISSIRDSRVGPLKVEVIHNIVIAHQEFALKIIEWVRTMALVCDGFRALTTYTLLGTYDPIPYQENEKVGDLLLIEKIMLSNTTYWKAGRIAWNELFVTTMLTDYSVKAQFGRLITRLYPRLVQDFINDDHDHSVSILTMTTQLYTVPSLICMLIEEENALTIISQTLVDICTREQNLNFDSGAMFTHGLKRGFYVISDLRHLINIRPTKWTVQLRSNVIQAVDIFLNLLTSMQGMDQVKRQVGQHLEYEPDWESGMNLQRVLNSLIGRLVTYCSFDAEVLSKILESVQLRLVERTTKQKTTTKEILGFKVKCILYDVSKEPISIHLPLTRFCAALTLEKMKMSPCERIPYDETLVLCRCGDKGRLTICEFMEPTLRAEVMIAQFRSGMWRRNGYSLVNQIAYFHEPFTRREMFDRDILLLQECAAMSEPNEFMIHLLNKFQLIRWVTSETTRDDTKPNGQYDDEDMMTQTMSLAEEFSQLLLTIISERYRPGIGMVDDQDVIKNEIIQLLCTNSLTRSEILHKLCLNDDEIDCIKTVADLNRSNQSSVGKYVLKEEFYQRFNPYFYHYSRRNQSDAHNAQLKRKKSNNESLICLPPPEPVKLTPQFSNLNELLKCDITLSMIQRVLRRACNQMPKSSLQFAVSDLQLDHCLHLIGLGLHEQFRSPTDFRYLQASHDYQVFELLKECYDKTKHNKDLVLWLMRKTYDLTSFMEDNFIDQLDEAAININRILKALFDQVLSENDPSKQERKKINSELAAQRREAILAKMRLKQKEFLSNLRNTELVADADQTEKEDDTLSTSHTCILCRDKQCIDFDQPTMVLLACVQRSGALSKNRSRRIPFATINRAEDTSNQMTHKYSFTTDNSYSFDATFMPSDLFFGPHVSSCGHVMHYSCWKGFFDAVMKRESGRPNRPNRHVSYDLDKLEVLCPLCECISNAAIPLIPDYTTFSARKTCKSIFSASKEDLDKSSENLAAFLHALRGVVDVNKHTRHIKEERANQEDKYLRILQPRAINEVLEGLNESENLGLREFINSIESDKVLSSNCSGNFLSSVSKLANRIHNIGLDTNNSVVDHSRQFMMNSWSISFTIQAFERVQRSNGKPLFSDTDSSKNLTLRSLLRSTCGSMMVFQSDLMQSLLLKKLRYLLINEEHLSSSPCCLDIDVFELFVSLFVLLQTLYKSETYAWTTRNYDHEYYRNLLHLMLILNMLQVCITMQGETSTSKERQPSEAPDCLALQSFYNDIVLASGHPISKIPTVDEEFASCIRHRLLPFLRYCAVFFYHLSQIEPPEQLRLKSAFYPENSTDEEFVDARSDSIVDSNAEFNSICEYLDLPNNFAILLNNQEVRHLARSWLRHSRVLALIKSNSQTSGSLTEVMPFKLIRQPHMANRLVDLPYYYSELLDKVSDFTCPGNKNEVLRTQTMCLICGVMLCSQSYCCQRDLNTLVQSTSQPSTAATNHHQQLVGSCTYHSYECSGGVGMFLRVRTCQVLVLTSKTRGCYMPAPYVDDHGEADFGLKRGTPSHLSRKNYDRLQGMWLSHSLVEYVSRTLEHDPRSADINWHLH